MPGGTHPRRNHGYALLALVTLLGLFTLLAVVRFVRVAGADQNAVEHDSAVLNQAKEALLGYAATYRDTHASIPPPSVGFLPCPASDGNGSAAGACSVQGSAVAGMLPFRTLSLPDLRDSRGECLWYAVAGTAKNSPSLLQFNWDVQGQFVIRDANGNPLATAPNSADGGPVAAIIAVGPPIGAQSRARASTTCGHTPVLAQFIEGGPVFPNAGSVDLRSGAAGSQTANDRVVWITGKELFDRIDKRADFAPMLNGLIDEMASCLGYGLPAPVSPSTTFGTNTFGIVPNVTTSGTPSICPPSGVSVNTDQIQLWRNWRELFRYMRCGGGTQCATVNAAACRGVLIFGGKRASGQSRATVTDKASAGNYLEGTILGTWTAGGLHYVGPGVYDPASPANDVVRCLN